MRKNIWGVSSYDLTPAVMENMEDKVYHHGKSGIYFTSLDEAKSFAEDLRRKNGNLIGFDILEHYLYDSNDEVE